MIEKSGSVSSQAVEKATGRDWDAWIALIDKEGGHWQKVLERLAQSIKLGVIYYQNSSFL
ncbi:MAG: hypothetical protein A2Z24_00565 [Candidatus Woykebacteria bacterium RBG_16_44_10]|uniref:Uncharacterized protein n=1 Tax=Candidatus Woykebacteria bacterium RBG_16_44_10 TaxID=1802597 RepID=A0A1G1WED2_9BACT|nr:MAG: hypothetical protein A2Z24_00565 [Candidatus Woykebacteria bacterium RBG_16_44_10]